MTRRCGLADKSVCVANIYMHVWSNSAERGIWKQIKSGLPKCTNDTSIIKLTKNGMVHGDYDWPIGSHTHVFLAIDVSKFVKVKIFLLQ